MSDHETSDWGRDDAHALSGAYAVDALDDAERARFEEHLRHCAHCREEVESLREAVTALGTDELVAPPSSVRDQVIAGIATIRPLPPLPPQTPSPTEAEEPQPAARDDLAGRRARRLPGARLLLAAAAAVLVGVVGVTSWFQGSDDDQSPPTVAEQILAAKDAEEVTKRFPDGAEATVVLSRSEGGAVITTEDMRPPPDGKDYQLWLQTPAGELQPAGLMPDIRDATVVLEGDASRTTGIGITVEPDGGSKQPTTEPIAFFTLKA